MAQMLVLRNFTHTNCKRSLFNLINGNLRAPATPPVYRPIHYCRSLQQQRDDHKNTASSLQARETQNEQAVSTDVRPLGEKIKETTKTVSYTTIIIAGISVTGLMFWAIFRELFSSNSPNNIYSKALDRVKSDPRVQDALGAPIKGFGEESRRGRRQHVAHTTFERHGVPHMRMQFYVQGIRNKATVELETREINGKMDYRYMFLQLDYYPHTTIILEDNRAFDPVPATSANYTQTNLQLTSLNEK